MCNVGGKNSSERGEGGRGAACVRKRWHGRLRKSEASKGGRKDAKKKSKCKSESVTDLQIIQIKDN